MKLSLSSKKNQSGYSLMEFLVMAMVLAIIMTIVVAVLVNILRQRTRTNFNIDVRASGDEVMTLLIKNIKDSRDINYEDTYAVSRSTKCWDSTPVSGNLCPEGYFPYCEFSQIRLDLDEKIDRTYYFDNINKRVLVKDFNKYTAEQAIYPVSPSSLRVRNLTFTIYPRLCYKLTEEPDYVFFHGVPEMPNHNLTVKVSLEIESPYVRTPTSKAYTQSSITLESTASLRVYNLL